MYQTAFKQFQQSSIIDLVSLYRDKAKKQSEKQQFNQHDYIRLKESIKQIKQKYQNSSYLQMQRLKDQIISKKQDLSRDIVHSNYHNNFCKGILENYIDDIRKSKKIKLLLGINQKHKRSNNTLISCHSNNKFLQLRESNTPKYIRDESILTNKFDYKFHRNNTVSKDQRRRRLPLQILKCCKNKDQNQYLNTLNSKRNNVRKSKMQTQTFQQNVDVFSIKNINQQSQLINDTVLLSQNSKIGNTFYRTKKSKKIKCNNKSVQQLFAKKDNIYHGSTGSSIVIQCQKEQQLTSQLYKKELQPLQNKKINLKLGKHIQFKKEPKNRKELFKIYSFLNKNNEELKSNRFRDSKQTFQGWSHINSIRQDIIQSII